MNVLTADGLTRRFGDLVAVNNLTFKVPAGGVVGFVWAERLGEVDDDSGLARPDQAEHWFGNGSGRDDSASYNVDLPLS